MQDLGTLIGGDWSVAQDINNVGQAVGWANTGAGISFPVTAVLWNTLTGVITDLGILPGSTGGSANATNDAGDVVGIATGGTMQEAFLYSASMMYNLEDLIPAGSGWQIWFADDINNDGWIVGTGIFAGERIVCIKALFPGCHEYPQVVGRSSTILDAVSGWIGVPEPEKGSSAEACISSFPAFKPTATLPRPLQSQPVWVFS